MKNAFLSWFPIVIFYLISSFMWAIFVPIFQAPDEPAHFYHVEYIAEHGRLPKGPYDPTVKASPYLENTLAQLNFNQIIHTKTLSFNFIEHSFYGENENLLSQNLWTHFYDKNYIYPGLTDPNLYFVFSIPIYNFFKNSILGQVYGLRFFSVFLSLVTFIFSFLAFKALFKDKSYAVFSAIAIGFFPMAMFINSSVNNDVLINLWFTVFFFLCIYYFKRPLNVYFYTSMAALIILAFSTKLQAFFMIPFLILYLVFRTEKISFYYKTKSVILLSFLLIMVSFLLIYLFYSSYLYLGLIAIKKMFLEETWSSFFINFVFVRYSRIFKSFFGRFGWLDTLLPSHYYVLFIVLVIMLTILVGYYIYFNYKKDRLFIFLLACVVFTDVLYGIFFVINGYYTGEFNFPSQGRYYFFLLLPIFYICFRSIFFVIPVTTKKLLLFVIAIGMILFNVVSLIQFVVPRYYV